VTVVIINLMCVFTVFTAACCAVLKTVKLEHDTIEEVCNMRSGLRKANLNYSVVDVKWSPVAGTNMVATAATNGVVLLWSMERSGQAQKRSPESALVLKEHGRSTNRICWHPIDPTLLLSCSQDAHIKLWVRAVTCGSAMQAAEAPRALRDRPCVVCVCGCLWVSVGVCGCLWVSVGVCGCLWVSVGVCGCLWVSVGVCGCLRVSAGVCGCLRVSTGVCGCGWGC
jgi:hypothetical protein